MIILTYVNGEKCSFFVRFFIFFDLYVGFIKKYCIFASETFVTDYDSDKEFNTLKRNKIHYKLDIF